MFVFLDLEYSLKLARVKEIGLCDVNDAFEMSEEKRILLEQYTEDGHIRSNNKTFKKLHGYLLFRLVGKEKNNIVVGWDVTHDTSMLSDLCTANVLPPIDMTFFDLQKCYMAIMGLERSVSLENAVAALGCGDEFKYHNASEDVRATVAVAKKLCERLGVTLTELVERYPQYRGEEKKSKTHWYEEKHLSYSDNSVNGFNVSLDFPVFCYKKNAGPRDKYGAVGGYCVYYNPLLDCCYYGKKHPGTAAKGQGSYLNGHPIYRDDTLKAMAQAAIRRDTAGFDKAHATVNSYDFIVSYDLVMKLEDGKMLLYFSNQALKEIGKKNLFSAAVAKHGLEGNRLEEFVKLLYNAKTFFPAVSKNKKWGYGGKEAEIVFSDLPLLTFDEAKAHGGEILIPRGFVYALQGMAEPLASVACEDGLKGLARADSVSSVSDLTDDPNIRLITVNRNGEAFAYIPFRTTVFCDFFNCEYTVPLLIRKPFELA